MLGTKIYKPIDTQEKCDEFCECANWCNKNGATLVEQKEYYECIVLEAQAE